MSIKLLFCGRWIITTVFVCICTTMDESFIVEQADESELLEASKVPYSASPNTVCKCTGMCLREKGRNACPCKNIGQFCSTVCHGRASRAACLNKRRVADGDASSSEDPTSETELSDEEFPNPSPSQPSSSRVSAQKRSKRSRQDSGGRFRRGRQGGQGRRRGRRARGGRGRGAGQLIEENISMINREQHEQQIQELINGLDVGALRRLSAELLRRQPAVFNDLVNGELPIYPNEQEPPGEPEPSTNKPDWCKCGLCIPMPTQAENQCCTKTVQACLTTRPLFTQLVLDGNVLDVAMRYREDILAMQHPRNNENFRHAAYRQFVLWQHGRLGQGNRRVVPSCCVKAIRNRFPSPNEVYVGYRPARL